jgi:hypothetical protein
MLLDAAVAQFVQHPEPELRAFVLFEPEAEDLLRAVGADAECDVHRLVADQPLVADLHPQRVEEHQGVDRLQRAGLPRGDLVQHGIRDRTDQVRRDLQAIEVKQMARDLPRAHATRVH